MSLSDTRQRKKTRDFGTVWDGENIDWTVRNGTAVLFGSMIVTVIYFSRYGLRGAYVCSESVAVTEWVR